MDPWESGDRLNRLSNTIIGGAIEVHRELGPGLLESAYGLCLCRELALRGVSLAREVEIPVTYKDVRLDCGYRADLIVDGSVIVELKTAENITGLHQAQLLTYLKLIGLHLGLIINFNVPALRTGVRRVVNKFPEDSAPPRLRGSDDPDHAIGD